MKILLLTVLFFISGVAFAQVFKCSDSGRVTYSTSLCSFGSVAYNNSALTVSETRPLIIQSAGRGGFYAEGSVNGSPVSFHVDTGATFTTLSGGDAYRLGVHSCSVAGSSSTANGNAAFCRVHVNKLTLGEFVFYNVDIQVMPSMSGASLFGLDLLGQLRFSHAGGVLTISR